VQQHRARLPLPPEAEVTTAASGWRDRAACRDKDPDLFFPVAAGGSSLAQEARARAVCALCPVTRQCLEFALSRAEAGVWGGTTEDERNAASRHLTRGAA
jgi:WhiB family transcriptional regulator, redox-sensing transcriptional regulator